MRSLDSASARLRHQNKTHALPHKAYRLTRDDVSAFLALSTRDRHALLPVGRSGGSSASLCLGRPSALACCRPQPSYGSRLVRDLLFGIGASGRHRLGTAGGPSSCALQLRPKQ
jgi:hypothetical protein